MDAAYVDYLEREWQKAQATESQLTAVARRTMKAAPRRVLDVGCGAGQELPPYVATAETCGVDVNPDAIETGRRLYASSRKDGLCPKLAVGPAEQLPFPDGHFDLVLSRLALPYTDNHRAIAEMARVLAPGGALVIKVHHLRYYLRQLRQAALHRDVRSAIHAVRVILCGAVFELTDRQPAIRRGGRVEREVFQLLRSTRRRLEQHGLRVVGGDEPGAPTPVIAAIKSPSNGR